MEPLKTQVLDAPVEYARATVWKREYDWLWWELDQSFETSFPDIPQLIFVMMSNER